MYLYSIVQLSVRLPGIPQPDSLIEFVNVKLCLVIIRMVAVRIPYIVGRH